MIKKLFSLPGLAVLVLVGLAVAQTPVRLVQPGTGKEVVVGAIGARYEAPMTTLPSSLTVLTSTTTRVQFIHCVNTTAGAITLTITDNQTSAKTYFAALSLAANSVLTANYGATGLLFQDGIKWNASATTSINCIVAGVQ